jgi:uncharacterized protein YhaN
VQVVQRFNPSVKISQKVDFSTWEDANVDNGDKRELKQGYVNLQYHFERLWMEKDKLIDQRFQASADARLAAKEDTERRLEALNALRESVEKDRSQFVKGETYDVKTKYYDEWCRMMEARMTSVETKIVTWVAAVALFSVIIQIVLRLVWK